MIRVALIAAILALAQSAHAQNFWYNTVPRFWTYQNEVTVEASVPGTYYQFMLLAPDDSYGGIQVLGNGDHVGIYSLGHLNGEDTIIVGYNNSFTWPPGMTDPDEGWGRFREPQGDGSIWRGSRFLFNYPWVEGVPYRLARREWLEADGRHIRTSIALWDGGSRAWTWIGAVRHRNAAAGQYFGNDRPNAFIERFAGNRGYKAAFFSNAWYQTPTGATGQLLGSPDSMLLIPQDDPNMRLTTQTGGFTLEQDGSVPAAGTGGQADGHSVGTTGPYSWPNSPGNAPLFMPFRVACGQTEITVGPDRHTSVDTSNNWEPDAYYSSGVPVRYSDFIDRQGVIEEAGSKYAFQGERYGEDFTYTVFGAQAGTTHAINLYFVEHFWNAAGARKQNVLINGKTVLSNFDIFAAAGNLKNKLVRRTFTATAQSDGTIRIRFVAVTTPQDKYATITAFEVL